MANRNEVPEISAGSMADIAFLLLIFFLVTTVIETEAGLDRMLPPVTSPTIPEINKRNLLEISLNDKGQLWIESRIVQLADLRDIAEAFLDNGGAPVGDLRYCDYCKGKSDPGSSDNPKIAVISLTTHRGSKYGVYITVQNELVAAYNSLRNREALQRYGYEFTFLQAQYQNPLTSTSKKKSLKKQINQIQELFPMNLLEAALK